MSQKDALLAGWISELTKTAWGMEEWEDKECIIKEGTITYEGEGERIKISLRWTKEAYCEQ